MPEGIERKMKGKKKSVPDGEMKNVPDGVGNQSESESKNVPVEGKTYQSVLRGK